MVEREIVIPPSKTTWAEQIAFCQAAREKLRQQHNDIGRQYREGKITEAQWLAYKAVFRESNLAVSGAIAERRTAVPSIDLDAVDLDRDIRDVS